MLINNIYALNASSIYMGVCHVASHTSISLANFIAILFIRFLLKNDGLFVGSSSAMNCVGAVRVAQAIGPGHTIVTILCDSGMRHLSKFHNTQYLSQHGLTPTATRLEFLGICRDSV